MLAKKLTFPHSQKCFSICRVSTFKVYAECKSFTDYSLIIVAEIYIIFRPELIRQMNSGPYSLVTDWSNDEVGTDWSNDEVGTDGSNDEVGTDGSNDEVGTDWSNDESGTKKMNPVLIRLFDDNKGKVPSQLLNMGACKEGTTEVLFHDIASILRENKVDWENCTAAGLDNTMVNVGKKNSIRTRVLAKNKNIFINGCTCHIIHNTANKAAERFSRSVRF